MCPILHLVKVDSMKKRLSPPLLAKWLLSKTINWQDRFGVLGDYQEEFLKLSSHNSLKARLWYWKQTLVSVIPFLFHRFLWELNMLKNYLKVAIRQIKRQKGTL